MNVRSLSCWLILSIGWLGMAQAQSISELEKQRTELSQAMAHTQRSLKRLDTDLSDWKLERSSIHQKIKYQQEASAQLRRRIRIDDQLIAKYSARIDSLDRAGLLHTEDLRERADAYYLASLKRQGAELISFNFFRDLRRRIYIRDYQQQMERTLVMIDSLRIQLEQDKSRSEDLRSINKMALDSVQLIARDIEVEKLELDALGNRLNKDKKKYQKELETHKENLAHLEHKIEEAIAASRRSAEERDLVLAAAFADNQGILPSPLAGSVIVSPYGEQTHMAQRQVKIFNNGIDLSSTLSPDVRAIFKGKVISIQEIPGAGRVVIINHGTYYSVYTKLDEIMVSIGDEIETSAILARLTGSPPYILHLEIWEEQNKRDPEDWIRLDP